MFIHSNEAGKTIQSKTKHRQNQILTQHLISTKVQVAELSQKKQHQFYKMRGASHAVNCRQQRRWNGNATRRRDFKKNLFICQWSRFRHERKPVSTWCEQHSASPWEVRWWKKTSKHKAEKCSPVGNKRKVFTLEFLRV